MTQYNCRLQEHPDLPTGDHVQGCIVDDVCAFVDAITAFQLANFTCPLTEEGIVLYHIMHVKPLA